MPLVVGVPKELKPGEGRVGLTPKGVKHLTAQDIHVYVEKGAGFKAGFSNQDYVRAGANLARDKKDLWKKADLIKKVKEPIAEEFEFFESRHILFTYLHLSSPSEKPLVDALIKKGVTAIGYETVERNGETPLLKPMSELAGVLAAYFAGVFQHYIQVKKDQIQGLPLAKMIMEQAAFNYPYVPKDVPMGQVVILGGGRVGVKTAVMAKRMGGTVFLSEISEAKRILLSKEFKSLGLSVHILDPKDEVMYEAFLTSCNVIIGAVHAAGERAPIVIDDALLKKISKQKKKIILDVAIDQGGNITGSRPVDYDDPLYLDAYGNIRFSVSNIPSICSNGASEALEEVTLDYTEQMAKNFDAALERYPELKAGVNILKGKLIHQAVRRAHGMEPERV